MHARVRRPTIVITAAIASVVFVAGLFVGAETLGAASSAPKYFIANINAAQETPPSPTGAIGNAMMTYDTSTDMLCYSIAIQHLGSAEIVAHFHGPAIAGTAAGIQFALPLGAMKSGCVGPLSKAQKSDLFNNLWYINIHSAGFPGGEARGQVLRMK